ncbi:cytochrome P450 [Pseudonocardia lutea]|uniref:Cytochrome P450 n=1 Tax=Pseudonocardia lutea TaxID=2172015 RepID=A0ABW1ICT4_9PSEU
MSTTRELFSLSLPEVDLPGEDLTADPAGACDRLRAHGPLVRTVRGVEVLSYAMARAMCVDPALDSIGAGYYENLGASDPIMWWATEGSLPMIEGARHDRIRRVLHRAFTRRRISALTPEMTALARESVARLPSDEPFDLVERFSGRFPVAVLCSLLGVPGDDVELFRGWLMDLGLLAAIPLAPHTPVIDAAIEGLRAYLRDLIDRRRRHPSDDMVSALVQASGPEGRLTESELEGALLNLLFAGHDTTRYQFASIVELVVEQGMWAQLRAERDLIPAVVEESMRLRPALHILLRRATADVHHLGVDIPAGTLLAVNVFAANRDPEAFPSPHRMDPRRDGVGRQLGFGHGAHLCLGHALARAEMAIALAAFLDRFDAVELAARPRFPEGFASMHGPEELTLRGV